MPNLEFPDRIIKFTLHDHDGLFISGDINRRFVAEFLTKVQHNFFCNVADIQDYVKNSIKVGEHYIHPDYSYRPIPHITITKETIKRIYEYHKQLQRSILETSGG